MKKISESRWSGLLVEAGLDPKTIEFISESRYDPYRRVYRDKDICYKIAVNGEITGSFRSNSLEQEYWVLKKCMGIQGIPKPIEYKKSNNTQLLAIQYLPGKSLDKLNLENANVWNIIKCILAINYRLVLIGVSHDDWSCSNVLVSRSDGVHLVDFDQAKITGRYAVFFRSFFGLRFGGPPYCKAMPSIFLYFLKRTSPITMSLLHKTQNVISWLKQRVIGKWWHVNVPHRLPELNDDASDSAKFMFVAWRIAQISDASAPGHLYAYYALEFEGYLFPGERPWIDRWNVLRAITDYSGKKILELGCNMGLLTSYLMKYEDAKGAFAVDVNEKIIEAAELINKALEVNVEHAVVNFDSKECWEDRLTEYNPDIVFALNLLNWVDDKERLIRFLGTFNALIFEGHDSLEVEKNRLQNIGYKNVSVIAMTERNRIVLFCEK